MKPGHPLTQARADAARTAPFWPFAPLSAHQARQRNALEVAMGADLLAAAAPAGAAWRLIQITLKRPA
jgi:hypothetical protein